MQVSHTIARNQAGKYIADRIKDQTVLAIGGEGKPILDEFGNPRRISRFLSLDDVPTHEDGTEGTSKAELAVTAKMGHGDKEDWLQTFIDGGGLDSLRSLVST